MVSSYVTKNCTAQIQPGHFFLLDTFVLQMTAANNSHQKMQKKEEDDE
jgi:hypothetical protein